MELSKIKFPAEAGSGIFDSIAEKAAEEIRNSKVNKKTQIRKFYDELIMWNERVQHSKISKEEKYIELEPFIKMLKAKVAYAKGRGHIDEKFQSIFNHCIDRIKDAKTLQHAKLFMEAVTGYSREMEK